jgi:hypothetical protein
MNYEDIKSKHIHIPEDLFNEQYEKFAKNYKGDYNGLSDPLLAFEVQIIKGIIKRGTKLQGNTKPPGKKSKKWLKGSGGDSDSDVKADDTDLERGTKEIGKE